MGNATKRKNNIFHPQNGFIRMGLHTFEIHLFLHKISVKTL